MSNTSNLRDNILYATFYLTFYFHICHFLWKQMIFNKNRQLYPVKYSIKWKDTQHYANKQISLEYVPSTVTERK